MNRREKIWKVSQSSWLVAYKNNICKRSINRLKIKKCSFNVVFNFNKSPKIAAAYAINCEKIIRTLVCLPLTTSIVKPTNLNSYWFCLLDLSPSLKRLLETILNRRSTSEEYTRISSAEPTSSTWRSAPYACSLNSARKTLRSKYPYTITSRVPADLPDPSSAGIYPDLQKFLCFWTPAHQPTLLSVKICTLVNKGHRQLIWSLQLRRSVGARGCSFRNY